MSTFRARLQHTSKLSLAPRDLKALHELISTEKNVVTSMSRLATDNRRAADALKEWGLGEGDDLSDILGKLAGLFGHLSDAQIRFSDHDATYRVHFKSVRMREENLAVLKKSRDALGSKIQGLEKKVSKMSPENKDLPNVTERLKEARGEMVGLEHSVANEEARLSDFKRETVRNAMSLKLGAMLELAEKMTIISELGRLLVDEVPMETTEPGGVRAPYYGAEKTQSIVNEAQRCLGEVVFNPAGGGSNAPQVSNVGGAYPNGPLPPPTPNDGPYYQNSQAQGQEQGEESAYGGFDPRHQSVLPGQSGLPYASGQDRDGPPRLDFEPGIPPISMASPIDARKQQDPQPQPQPPTPSRGGGRTSGDYDPIRAAAQQHMQERGGAEERSPPPDFSEAADPYWGRGNHAGPPPGAGGAIQPPAPPPLSEKAPSSPAWRDPPQAPATPPTPRTPVGGGPAGRPPAVRGDSALGSRHGFDMGDTDLYAPRPAYSGGGAGGAAANAAASSGSYSSAREGKRVNAGAFRKPQPNYSLVPSIPGGAGGGGMQVSGYQGPPPAAGPSASEAIKQQYMQRWSGDEDDMQAATAPLNVSKRRSVTPDFRGSNAPSADGHSHSGTSHRGGGAVEDGEPPRQQDRPAGSGFGAHPYVTNLD